MDQSLDSFIERQGMRVKPTSLSGMIPSSFPVLPWELPQPPGGTNKVSAGLPVF